MRPVFDGYFWQFPQVERPGGSEMLDNFCPKCGSRLEVRRIAADKQDRQVCTGCGEIQYRNPRILVSGMVTCGKRLLLCRRAQNPALGLWTPPAGFMEMGETLENAAARETQEETGVVVDSERMMLYSVTSFPTIGEVDNESCAAGPEAFEAGYFSESEIPWDRLAYPEMAGYLKGFFRELYAGEDWIHLSLSNESLRARRGYRVVAMTDYAKSQPPREPS